MIIVLQRVRSARVEVAGKITGEIGPGLLLLVGIEKGDGSVEMKYLAEKVLNLRVFPDAHQKMNRSVKEIGGAILTVSQFTLSGDIRKGRRPDFTKAARPDLAEPLYHDLNRRLAEEIEVHTGIFGAMMDVYLLNDGPVTLILEKRPDTENPTIKRCV